MISKRLRFEVLRRDGYRCRYCGRDASDVRLVIDHVIPEALGGTTVPENLVAACVECNTGKSSIAPGGPLVDDVEADALRWAQAMKQSADIKSAEYALIDAVVRAVDEEWEGWTTRTPGGRKKQVPRRDDWADSIGHFLSLGLTGEMLVRLVRVAMTHYEVAPEHTWSYYCGCCWRTLEDLQKDARQHLREDQDRGL